MRLIASIFIIGLLTAGCGGSGHGGGGAPAPVVPPTPADITNVTLPNGTVGQPYAVVMTATGVAPFTWSFSGPAGLGINSQTGLLAGKPVTAGVRQSALVIVYGANGAQASHGYDLTIN